MSLKLYVYCFNPPGPYEQALEQYAGETGAQVIYQDARSKSRYPAFVVPAVTILKDNRWRTLGITNDVTETMAKIREAVAECE